ncbi:ubiquitin carboxyl-terminal hydrolase 48 [Rhodotorula toruloides]|uniref:ubiquitinyl hydrolase 1 n=1 Tax=Rhodotorula toruloides TaxID=5286 RepID=A0A511KGW2_RHOTO|nr:ubiquitin carboxyl-terminal hydrolase 48 [Rhodotorula toruloides]
MPPKKKAGAATTIHADVVAAFDETKSTASLRPDRLSNDLLARAYGLAGPRDGQNLVKPLHKACPPRWTEEAEQERVKKEEVKEGPEVIVLDGTDDEGKRTSGGDKKGKGKAKAGSGEVKEKPCSPENCGNNPRCLNWLGQDTWENSDKALKDFRKAAGLPADPSNDRDPDVPVGLKNLGATCYANSFLQVWFRDTKFREGVYSVLPPATGIVESSPVFQLQVLFTFLQTSKQAVYDPDPLVESLKIKKTEQQDAQEFSKLFLNLLDMQFQKQEKRVQAEGGSTKIGQLVAEQFGGRITYGTQCLSCKSKSAHPSTFFELEVNLTKNCKLEDRIKASLESEKLEGDNQYFCETCGKKRDAMRYTELAELPPVLHVSLLRFVWDMVTGERSKSQHAMTYPLQIDMGQFLSPDAYGNKHELWYDLKGVLMHKGVSAHHGHYVAQVYDESQSKWFLFDDETVTPIDDLNSPTTYDEDEAPVSSKKRPSKGFTRDERGNILPKSKDAYMLVYTRRCDPSDPSAAAEPAPPPLAQFTVENLDWAYHKEVEGWIDRSKEIERSFEKMRDVKRSIYRIWDVIEDDEEAFLVDKHELRRWVEEGIKKPGKGKEKATDADEKGENAIIVEEEGQKEASSATPKGDSEQKDEKFEDTDMPNADKSGSRSATSEPLTPPKSPPPASTNGKAAVPDESKTEMGDDDLPHPSELAPHMSPAEPIKFLSNDRVVCEHRLAKPQKADQMKRVSQYAVMALRDIGVTISPELRTPSSFCRECVGAIAADIVYAKQHLKDIDELKKTENAGLEQDKTAWISREWYRDWIKNKPKMHVAGTTVDPSPNDKPFIDDVLCEHGKRQPNTSKRKDIGKETIKFLRKVFSGFEPIVNPDSCEICEGQHEQVEQEDQEARGRASLVKKHIKSFEDQTRLTGTRLAISSDDTAHFVVPRTYMVKLMKWQKLRTPTAAGQPGNLDNSQFICKHGDLCLDLDAEIENPRKIDITTEQEWRFLANYYNADPAITIWQEAGLQHPSSNPRVCEECLADEKRNFEVGELKVRSLSASDFDENNDRKIEPEGSPETERPEPTGSIRQYGQRASTRIKYKSNHPNWSKPLKTINFEKGDQVKDLKSRIEIELKYPFVTQRLFFKAQELEDASATVEELGIFNGDTVEVYAVGMDGDYDPSAFEDKPTKRKGKRAREEGFTGTGLFGFDEQQGSEDASRSGAGGSSEAAEGGEVEVSGREKRAKKVAPPSTAAPNGDFEDVDMDDQIPCPGCTFLNNAALSNCEMCDSELKG